MFNTKQYEWKDVVVVLGGSEVTGIRGIEYTQKQEKEVYYAKGSIGHSVQRGNVSVEGKISLSQAEYEAIRDASPNKSILGINVNIAVSYGNPSNGDVMVTDEIQYCEFTEEPKAMNQGDKFMEIELPFIALNVKKVS